CSASSAIYRPLTGRVAGAGRSCRLFADGILRVGILACACARTRCLAAALCLPYPEDRERNAHKQENRGEDHVTALILAIGDHDPDHQQRKRDGYWHGYSPNAA